MSNLFSTSLSRQSTQLAYKVRCFPWQDLPDAGKKLVSWRRFTHMTKAQLLASVNEDKTMLLYRGREYLMLWSYGNKPTLTEWNKKSDSFQISVDIRFSPAIPELAVAILSFDLPNGQGSVA